MLHMLNEKGMEWTDSKTKQTYYRLREIPTMKESPIDNKGIDLVFKVTFYIYIRIILKIKTLRKGRRKRRGE